MQVNVGILIVGVKTIEESFCVLQKLEANMEDDGRPVLNDIDCPLYGLKKTLVNVASTNIISPISVVHECTHLCKFSSQLTQCLYERETINKQQIIYQHDYTHPLFSLNVYCMNCMKCID